MTQKFNPVEGEPHLVENRLVWPETTAQNHWARVEPRPDRLVEFVALAEATADAILHYARRWGALGLCGHELPASHAPAKLWPEVTPSADEAPSCSEPLNAWRRYARHARAIVRLAAALRENKERRLDDWIVLQIPLDPREEAERGLSGLQAAMVVADALAGNDPDRDPEIGIIDGRVAEWLALAAVQWHPEMAADARLVPWGWGLFGAIAVDLLLAVVGSESPVPCTSCGAPYIPSRRLVSGVRHYCPECRKAGVEYRDAARDYRRRQREQRKHDDSR
jgi:hypothetical protein